VYSITAVEQGSQLSLNATPSFAFTAEPPANPDKGTLRGHRGQPQLWPFTFAINLHSFASFKTELSFLLSTIFFAPPTRYFDLYIISDPIIS
jgi:hypothetical protein